MHTLCNDMELEDQRICFKKPQVIGVLNVESDKVAFSIVSLETGRVVATSERNVPLMMLATDEFSRESDEKRRTNDCETPRADPVESGRVEQDPGRLWRDIETVVGEVLDAVHPKDKNNCCHEWIKSVNVVNEMGSLVAWHADTGAELYNVIHWSDARMMATGHGVDTSAAVAWLLSNSTAVERAGDRCRFGTLDAWVRWKLTDGNSYGTDLSNASCTGLLDVATLDWDPMACLAAGLTVDSWPMVRDWWNTCDSVTLPSSRLVNRMLGTFLARPAATLLGQAYGRPGVAAVTVKDRAVVVACECDREHALVAADERSVVTPLVVALDYNHGGQSLPVMYALMVVSKAPAGLRLGLRPSIAQRWSSYRRGEKCWFPDDNDDDADLVVCSTNGRVIAAPVDSVYLTVIEAVRLAVHGSGKPRLEQLAVDGPYGSYANLLRSLADVSGTTVHGSLIDPACNGVALITGLRAWIRNNGKVYEPRSSSVQRDKWLRDLNVTVLQELGWTGGRPHCRDVVSKSTHDLALCQDVSTMTHDVPVYRDVSTTTHDLVLCRDVSTTTHDVPVYRDVVSTSTQTADDSVKSKLDLLAVYALSGLVLLLGGRRLFT